MQGEKGLLKTEGPGKNSKEGHLLLFRRGGRKEDWAASKERIPLLLGWEGEARQTGWEASLKGNQQKAERGGEGFRIVYTCCQTDNA